MNMFGWGGREEEVDGFRILFLQKNQIGIRVQGGYQRDWKGNILVELRL